MAKNNTCKTAKQLRAPNQANEPRSVALARSGVKTDTDFINLMSALMTDLLDSLVSPAGARAMTKAAKLPTRHFGHL